MSVPGDPSSTPRGVLRPEVWKARVLPEWHRGDRRPAPLPPFRAAVAGLAIALALLMASLSIHHRELRWIAGRIIAGEDGAQPVAVVGLHRFRIHLDEPPASAPAPGTPLILRVGSRRLDVVVAAGSASNRLVVAATAPEGLGPGATVSIGLPGESRSLLRWLVPDRP